MVAVFKLVPLILFFLHFQRENVTIVIPVKMAMIVGIILGILQAKPAHYMKPVTILHVRMPTIQ